jgi:hypothetical protein
MRTGLERRQAARYPAGGGGRGISRRDFAALAMTVAIPAARGATAAAGRDLDFRVRPEGFGGAGATDIRAVARSAAEEIWRHCPDTRLPPAGFELYHNDRNPITHFDLSPDGRVVIGLCVTGPFWAQLAFQFAHEFAHALMDHSNDRDRLWRQPGHANQWLEESLAETASLFSLRAMGRTWAVDPPFPNWRTYAPNLTGYAQERLDEPAHQLPAGQAFGTWFATEESSLRKDPVQRDKNFLVARQLLPRFEAEPRGWEALPSLKLGTRDPAQPLAAHLAEWRAHAPESQRAFVAGVAGVFGVARP